jgi:hypothetical protein
MNQHDTPAKVTSTDGLGPDGERDAIAEIERLHADAERAKSLIRRLATEARQSGDLVRDPEALALAAMYYGA